MNPTSLNGGAPPGATGGTALASLLRGDEVAARLAALGLGTPAAATSGGLFAGAARHLVERGYPEGTAAVALYVPGRIEVLGKHTDYGGGRSLVAAVERGFSMIAVPRGDARIRIMDVVLDEEIEFALAPDLEPEPGHWSNYPMTAARRAVRNFPMMRTGIELALGSNLPMAAGMSSSSALMVGTFLALSRINDLPSTAAYRDSIDGSEALAGYLGCIENGDTFGSLEGDRGVGTFGGSEDHTAILCAQPGTLSEYSYAPVRLRSTVRLPEGFLFAIASSGVAAAKTGEAMDRYNRASRLMEILLETWNTMTGHRARHLTAALAGGVEAIEHFRGMIERADHRGATTGELLRRFEHFVAENQHIVPGAVRALKGGDLGGFGELADRSQQLAERLLGNQIEETIHLARSARREGAVAASAFGAGFGGSVWALVGCGDADRFVEAWAEGYRARFPERAESSCFFVSGAGPPALVLE